MRFSYGLPTHMVEAGPELVSGEAIAELARAAESAGFDAAYVTEHPFPADDWLAKGGHHALDPMVALAVAAAATTTLRLHTNLFIPAYRNPFLAAKAVATLDVISEGRVILGVGSGYLQGEFEALGADFADRNDVTDQALEAMKAAWRGESLAMEGPGYSAPGNTMLPRPVQRPHPPIWVGGNSRRAIRRAVELGDGWCPFPNPAKVAARTRTAVITGAADLERQLVYATEHAAAVGRSEPLEVVFIPEGLAMGAREMDTKRVVASCQELAAIGVGWVTVALPGSTRAAQLSSIAELGENVIPELS